MESANMSSQTGQLTDEERYPGVNRAYDFVMPSYQMLMSRYEAADNRLTAMLTLASSVTLGLPVLAKALRPDATFDSTWFRIGIVVFILLIAVGITGRIRGQLMLPNPRRLYYRNLHESEWMFKENAIYFAGLHFDRNASAIRIKGNFATAITLLFAAEALVMLAWMAQ
jgi:hypothetical protein